MFKGKCVRNGVVHVTSGNAGFSLDSEWMNPPPEWSVKRCTEFGYTKIFVYNSTTLRLQHVLSKTKEVFDEFVIRKSW